MWIIAGAGFPELVGRDWKTGPCMDYMPLPILFGQSVCMFQCDRLLSTGSLFLGLHFRYADSIGKNMQTLAGGVQNGFSTEGFYVGFLLPDFGSGVYIAHTGLIKRNHKRQFMPL